MVTSFSFIHVVNNFVAVFANSLNVFEKLLNNAYNLFLLIAIKMVWNIVFDFEKKLIGC